MANQKKEFGKIYDKYINKIYRFVFVKVSSEEIAQDICSETFLKGWEAFKGNTKIDNPSAFLYQVARNLVIDHYRQKGKAQIVSTDSLPIPDPRTGLEERIALNSDLDQIKASLVNLREDYQNVIIWRYLDDMSIPEVAKMMNKSEEATRVTLCRALKCLKDEVNQPKSVSPVLTEEV
jgi:RNA polymerase sigma-70 factor (ECF subfamily)